MNSWLVRHLLYPLHERLRGRTTFRFLKRFRATEKLAPAAVADEQHRLLQNLIGHAATESEYWRQHFSQSAVPAASIKTRADLQQLPFMDKAIIRDHREALVADARRAEVFRLETGGSSGVPLSFYTDQGRESSQLAAKARAREWFGIHFGDRQMDLWGSPIELAKKDRLRLWKDRLLNFEILSAFALSDEKMATFLPAMQRQGTQFLYGYASVLTRYAKFLEAQNLSLKSLKLKAAIATAELLIPEDADVIARVFGCPVVNEYGCRDGGLIAQSCPEGKLHIAADTVLIEIIDEAGRVLPEGEVGEVVVTNLWSYGMPLIRYRLGDRAARSTAVCACGRSLPVLEHLQGRKTDTLVRPDGNRIHGLAAMYILRVMPEVKQYQVIQDAVDHVEILIVPTPHADLGAAENQIRQGFVKLLGQEMRIDLRLVETIPQLASGKMRAIWNQLS